MATNPPTAEEWAAFQEYQKQQSSQQEDSNPSLEASLSGITISEDLKEATVNLYVSRYGHSLVAKIPVEDVTERVDATKDS